MKALVLKEYNKLSYEEVPEPAHGKGDLLVRVKACAICGSDVQGIDGSTGRRRPPIIMGHEAAGVVEAVGSDVKGFKVGDRITFDSTIFCGECYFCRKGQINLCDNRRVLGVSCNEYHQNGAFAEYVAIPSRIAYHLPEQVSFEQAAMVEPVSIAVHAVSLCKVLPNDAALVVGAGMIGLFIIQVLRIVGCGQIIAVDLDENKFELARQFGATACLNAGSEDLNEQILELTNGRGADLAFEVVGISATIQTAVQGVRKGGALVLVGNLQPRVDFPLQSVVTRQISMYGSCASNGEYPACLDLIASGKIDVDVLVSASVPLEEGASWFKRLYEKEPGLLKVVLKP
ncbi:MAG TPA: galactitol-1-phosphate 5-dehydrogenase [Limnochordia bacterium]|nr:galactitol-1-phosphate 5-dehydrogenase [Limnochordia bacterium]